ncbi:Uncharacterised protein [Serratia fonticola]|nr:Uncharacterised protein [Serratia fonticola]
MFHSNVLPAFWKRKKRGHQKEAEGGHDDHDRSDHFSD